MTKVAELTPPKDNATDAAFERETVVGWSDGDSMMVIHTAQRKVITELSKNPSARLIEHDGPTLDKATNAVFELPVGFLTFRGKQRQRRSADTTKKVARAMNATKCDHVKEDGTKCQMVAKKGTTRCRWHSE